MCGITGIINKNKDVSISSALNMSKKGLRLPLEHWISNELKEFVFDSISKFKNRNLFNNQKIDETLKINNE